MSKQCADECAEKKQEELAMAQVAGAFITDATVFVAGSTSRIPPTSLWVHKPTLRAPVEFSVVVAASYDPFACPIDFDDAD